MTICGHAGINFMRGPSFSNMVKSGRVKRGCFKLSDLSLQERGERYLLGAAVPSVRAINVASKPEDKIDCGGMSKPLRASVQALSRAIPERLSEVMRVPLQPLAPGALRAKLLALPVIKFDNEGARRDMHGERPRARLQPGWSFPSSPRKDGRRKIRAAGGPRICLKMCLCRSLRFHRTIM